MPKPYPKEFRDDVVAVARKGQAPLNQIAKDFGISEGCLHNWMTQADVEDGSPAALHQSTRVARSRASMPWACCWRLNLLPISCCPARTSPS